MSVQRQYKCDMEGCGAIRKQTNHWWMLVLQATGGITVLRWNEAKAGRKGTVHLCGQNCLSKALSQWMATIPASAVVTEGEANNAASEN